MLPLLIGTTSKLLGPSGSTSASSKKISKEKLLSPSDTKKDTNKVKVVEKKLKLLPPSRKINLISPADEIKNIDDKSTKEKSIENLRKKTDFITKTLENIIKFFKLKRKNESKEYQEERKQKEIENKKQKEEDLEKKKPAEAKKIGLPSTPKLSFLDSIMNFFTTILIGSFVKFLYNNSQKIFDMLDDISSGLNNIWNVTRISIISLSTVFRKQIRFVAKLGKYLLKGPIKATKFLFKKLGNSLKTLLKNVGSFVVNNIKRVAGITGSAIGGASTGATRATGTASRSAQTPSGKPRKPVKPVKPARPTTPRATSPFATSKANRFFGGKGFKHLQKVSKIFKRIPFVGALIGIGIDMAMGEQLDNAVAGAAGASLGSAIGAGVGSLIFPGLGTLAGGFIGGVVGDWAGKEIYKQLKAKVFKIKPPEEELDTPSKSPSTPSPGTTPLSLGYAGSGAPGQLYTSNASVTWYDPGLGGINSATGKRDPNARTSTGEPYQASAFTAAAFPPFLSSLPLNMTTKSLYNPSGRTLASGQQFNVLVTNKKTGKSAILRVNDVGSGTGPVSKQTKWLDFSIAARDYLGTGSGFEIRMAPPGSKPGPLDASGVQQIQNMGASAPANATSSYTVSGITYDTATGKPIDFPGQRTSTPTTPLVGGGQVTSTQMGTKTGLVTGYGGGDPFHIDTRWARDLPMDVVVPMIDSMASTLAADGRVMEMGEAGSVSGKRYPLNGTRAQKEAFLRAATAGHHKQRSMAAFDYFIPKSNETQWGNSAKYANIPAPALPPGYKISFHQGRAADGGAFYQITDPSGRVVFKTLHGDPTKSRLGLMGQQNNLQQRIQQIRQQASYEGQQQIVPIPIPLGGESTPAISGGGTRVVPIGVSKQALLNSYYQTQLIGFLYKQG